jgi:lysozyme
MNEGMKINAAGLAIIKKDESCVLVAYRDPGSASGLPITCGWGSTHRRDDNTFFLGESITQEEADWLLARDLGEEERVIYQHVMVPLNTNQFSGLGSFIYNIGETQFASSTLLRLLNAGQFDAAAGQFGLWINGASGPLPGLITRRAEEKALFLTPVVTVEAVAPAPAALPDAPVLKTVPDVVPPPQQPPGTVTSESGNTTIVDIKDSQIVKKSDSITKVATAAASATAAVTAATPIVTTAAGMNWKLVAAFAALGIAIILGAALAWCVFKALGIKSDRLKMFFQGIA